MQNNSRPNMVGTYTTWWLDENEEKKERKIAEDANEKDDSQEIK